MVIPEVLRILINNVIQTERSKYLKTRQYERIDDSKGSANGYKLNTIRTSIGEITFAVPQV
jgi:putative transposase